MKGILGKKVGMTRVFTEQGEVIPVTIIEAGPCYVAQRKTIEQDGYNAVQLGFEEVPSKKLTRPEAEHLRKKGLPALRYLRELRLKEDESYSEGEKILADVFQVGQRVDVIGISKGRGFAGGMKRHGFSGGPKTHGQSDRPRSPGSVGSGTTPGRVYKGLRMAGHMGDVRVTVESLEVMMVDAERNLLAVRGGVPGSKGGLLIVREARKQD
jgi:large subunit ribosomal protein L3